MSQITAIVETHRPELTPYISLYKHFHTHPELSFQEVETAAKIHAELSKLGSYEVIPKIGGTGLAAVFKNGKGKTVLLRADIDALPVAEKTGLDYASTKVMKDLEGVEKGVMHVCATLSNTTRLVYSTKADAFIGVWTRRPYHELIGCSRIVAEG
jgi:metal-dependent amidase/aminoacylase/carboxypeptidase family protein